MLENAQRSKPACSAPRQLSNLDVLGPQVNVTSRQWYELIAQYARVHTRSHPVQPSDVQGKAVPPCPWVSEDIHPDLGYWIARDYMLRWAQFWQSRLHSWTLASRFCQSESIRYFPGPPVYVLQLIEKLDKSAGLLSCKAPLGRTRSTADDIPQGQLCIGLGSTAVKLSVCDRRHGEADWRRGYSYLHSTFCDLVITGLVGLRPRADHLLVVHPLVPDSVQWFALDSLLYHGLNLAIVWDRTGERYGRGVGLSVWVDGRLLARSSRIQRLELDLTNRTELS